MAELPEAFLAFQGGGALGMAHLGAWCELAEQFRIVGVSGTSAGAILAGLCAAGAEPARVSQLLLDLDWRPFIQRQNLMNILFKREGLVDPRPFERWFRKQLKLQLLNEVDDPTFEQVHERTGVYLGIVATDLNDPQAEPVVFDHETEPRTSVAYAVRASFSIPGFFIATPRLERNQMLVDGGVLLNLPLQPVAQRAKQAGCLLIGVRFRQPPDYLQSARAVGVLKASLGVMMRRGSVPPADLVDTGSYLDVTIDVEGFSSLDFTIDGARKNELIRRGRLAALDALAQWRTTFQGSEQESTVSNLVGIGPATPPINGSGQDAALVDESTNHRYALEDALLACRSMNDSWQRSAIIDRLGESRLGLPTAARLDALVSAIVDGCINHHDRLDRLLQAVERYERGSTEARALRDVVNRIKSRQQPH